MRRVTRSASASIVSSIRRFWSSVNRSQLRSRVEREALDAGERGAQLVGDGGEQCGALGLGAAAALGVAQAEHDGAHRLPRAAAHVLRRDEQLATRGQHEQPLAVPGAGERGPARGR